MGTLSQLSNKIWFRAILFTAAWFATRYIGGHIIYSYDDISAAFWFESGTYFYLYAITFWILIDKFILSHFLTKLSLALRISAVITSAAFIYWPILIVGLRVAKFINTIA